MSVPYCRSFGDYLLVGEIASGGMGIVYQAIHNHLNRPCALKLIRSGAFATPMERARFIAEAEAAAALDHPGIVKVRNSGEIEGQLFLEMELVEGGTLAERLVDGPMELDSAARLVELLAGAVQHAHDRGVLHRDLKPGNVLLDADDTPRLADFGLARLLHRESDLTRSMAVLGTPAYLAPEIAGGRAQTATTLADVYGLGAILYQVLTGRAPYVGESSLFVLEAVKQGAPQPPSRLRPGIPRDLEIITMRAMAREPSERMSTAGELAAELGRWRRGDPIRSRPVRAWEQVWAWARRSPAMASLAGVLLGVVLVALVVTDAQRREARALSRTLLRQWSTAAAGQASEEFRSTHSHRGLSALARVARRDPENLAVSIQLALGLIDRVWPKPAFVLGTAGTEVREAATSPDGTRLVTATSDGKIRIWDAKTGAFKGIEWTQPEERWKRVVFDWKGEWVMGLGAKGSLRLWPARGGEPVVSIESGAEGALDALFHPGSSILAVAREGHPVRLIDPGREARDLPVETRGTRVLSFSPTATVMAMGGADPVIRFWSFQQQKLRPPLSIPAPAVGISYGDAGHVLAVTTREKELVMYGIPDAIEIGRWPHVAPGVARFNPGGRMLFHSPSRESISFFKSPWLESRGLSPRRPYPAWGLSFSQDGARVLIDGPQRGVQPFEFRPRGGSGEVGESIPHSWEISKAIVLKDRNRILVAGGTNDAVVWDVDRAHPARQRRVLRGQLIAAGFTADSRELRVFTKTGVVRKMAVLKSLPATNRVVVPFGVEAAAFAPGANQLAIASGTNGWIWEVEPSRQMAVLPPGTGRITDVAFSPDGQTLAVADEDASLLLWDVMRGVVRAGRLDLKPASTANSAGIRLQSVEFTADSRWLAVAGDSGLVHVIEVGTGKILAVLEHGAPVPRAVVLPGGKRVATACHSGEARIWDIATAKPVGRPMPHAGMILDLDVSPDGRRVATAGDDRAIRVWDVERGTRVSEFTTTRSFSKTRFFGNGRGLISSTKEDGVVLLHDPETGQVLTRRREFGAPSNRFVVSPNGEWMAMYPHGMDGVLTSVVMPSTPAPPWVLDLAESIAGERIQADDTVEPLMPSEYLRLRDRISGLKGDDYWQRFLLPGLLEGVLDEGEEP